MSEHYFSYDPNDRFYTHATADAAREGAKAILDGYRDEAREGWADEASGVCWGRICGTVEVTERSAAQPDSWYDFDMEYALVNTEQEAIGLTLEAEIEARQEDVELAHEDREKAQAAAKAEIERLRAAAEGVLRYVTPPRGDLRGMAAIGNLDAALRGEEAEDE